MYYISTQPYTIQLAHQTEFDAYEMHVMDVMRISYEQNGRSLTLPIGTQCFTGDPYITPQDRESDEEITGWEESDLYLIEGVLLCIVWGRKLLHKAYSTSPICEFARMHIPSGTGSQLCRHIDQDTLTERGIPMPVKNMSKTWNDEHYWGRFIY